MRQLVLMCFAALLSTGACQEAAPTVPLVTIEQIAADPAAYDRQRVRVKGKYRVLGDGPIPACIPIATGTRTVSDQYRSRDSYWVLTGTNAQLGVMIVFNDTERNNRYTLLNVNAGDQVELVGTFKYAPVEDPCRKGLFSKSAYLLIDQAENPQYFR